MSFGVIAALIGVVFLGERIGLVHALAMALCSSRLRAH